MTSFETTTPAQGSDLGESPTVALRLVEEGFDFTVVIVDETWVVRVPRRPAVAEALEFEATLLPRIAPTLPVAVPEFALVSHEPPFVVYRMIAGSPFAGEDVEGVARFLAALHATDTDGLPREDWVERYRAQCERFRELVLPLLAADERRAAERLFAEADSLTGFEPALIHGDLGAEHMLVREGRLVGVIDWADACVGDPALDYVWLTHHLSPAFDVDMETQRRASFYYRLAPFYSVHYGVFARKPDYVERGLEALRARLSPRP